MILWPCFKSILLFYVIYISICAEIEATICEGDLQEFIQEGRKQFNSDVPSLTDLVDYLKSLHYIAIYSNQYPKVVDVNLAFGLKEINVNLKNEMKHPNRRLDPLIWTRMKEIVDLTDQVLTNFVTQTEANLRPVDKLIFTLFLNETMWMERMIPFDSRRPQVALTSPNELQRIYKSWDIYMTNVQKGVPTEKQSDECQAAMSNNSVIPLEEDTQCELPRTCRDLIRNGSNVGYSLSHRILLLLTARLGRGCTVFSIKEFDQELMDELCTHSYIEAQYISMNHFQALDLFIEHIAICTIAGHAEFLRKTWVNFVMLHQMPIGCFHQDLNLVKEHRLKALLSNQQDISDAYCDIHMTAAAAIALATASRYVTSTYGKTGI